MFEVRFDVSVDGHTRVKDVSSTSSQRGANHDKGTDQDSIKKKADEQSGSDTIATRDSYDDYSLRNNII